MLEKACEKFKLLSKNFYRQYSDNFQKKLLVANILLPELKIWSDLSQSISLQKCIQITDILSLFLLHKNLLPKCKKSLKKCGNFPPIV
jgi:hypothetical protein